MSKKYKEEMFVNAEQLIISVEESNTQDRGRYLNCYSLDEEEEDDSDLKPSELTRRGCKSAAYSLARYRVPTRL